MEHTSINNIENLMLNGNWTDAIISFKQLNISPNEFRQYLETNNTDLLNWAILGYYAKED
jgi:hypothetical protein